MHVVQTTMQPVRGGMHASRTTMQPVHPCMHALRRTLQALQHRMHVARTTMHATHPRSHASRRGVHGLHAWSGRLYPRLPVDKRSKVSRAARMRAFIAALPEYMDVLAPLLLAGKGTKVGDLLVFFQEELDAMDRVKRATAERSEAVARERFLTRRNKPLLAYLETIVRGVFGEDRRVMTAFQLQPRKPGRKSAEVKRDAAEKARATRAAKAAARKAAKASRPVGKRKPSKRRR